MTPAECLEKVRAVAALERVKAVIALNALDADWTYVVTAIEWELKSLQYVLSLEDRTLIDAALERYAYERQTALPEPMRSDVVAPEAEYLNTHERPPARVH